MGIKSCFIASIYPYFFYFLMKRNNSKIVFYLFVIITILFAILLESRSLFFCILISVCLLSNKFKKVNFTWIFIISIILLFLKWESFQGRFFIWKIILSNIISVPLFGFGLNTFKQNYSIWQIEYFRSNKEWSTYHYLADSPFSGYNELLTYYIEVGIIGPVIILILFFVNIFFLNKYKFQFPSVASVSFINIFFFSLFYYSLHSLLIISVVIINHLIIFYFLFRKKFILIILFSGIIFFLHYINQNIEAKKNWKYAQSIPIHYIDDKMKYYLLSYSELGNNEFYLTDYCQFLVSSGLYDEALNLLHKKRKYFNQYQWYLFLGDITFFKENFNKSIQYYKNANMLIPNRIIPLDQLLNIALHLGDIQGVLYYSELIVKQPIKVESERTKFIQKKAKNILKNYK